MKATLQASDPNKIQFTLSITMPLEDWLILAEQLHKEWPSSELRYAISDMTIQAKNKFYPKEKAE